VRTHSGHRERRAGLRLDVRLRAELCTMSGQAVTRVEKVRLREISQLGGSLMLGGKLKIGEQVLLRLHGRDGNCYWLWCQCRRCQTIDQLCTMLGVSWLRLLYPGQDVGIGTKPESLMWLDVQGTKLPDDPFQDEFKAA
jgi:hypothetical protein